MIQYSMRGSLDIKLAQRLNGEKAETTMTQRVININTVTGDTLTEKDAIKIEKAAEIRREKLILRRQRALAKKAAIEDEIKAIETELKAEVKDLMSSEMKRIEEATKKAAKTGKTLEPAERHVMLKARSFKVCAVWKDGNRFDQTAFKKDHEKLYDQYRKTSFSWSFSYPAIGKNESEKTEKKAV